MPHARPARVTVKLARTLLLLLAPSVASAQGSTACKPYLQFQVQARLPNPTHIKATQLRGTLYREPMSVVSLSPFDLKTDTDNSVSLLVLIWNGGLSPSVVDRFAASLRREERLHLRLSVLTRSNQQTAWTDDPSQQHRLLSAAATEASSARDDAPGAQPITSDGHVLESRWNTALQTSVEDLMQQPGKQVILELLAPPPLRPPVSDDHWRIPTDRDYLGEQQVHTSAALGLIPVYRVHNDRRTLSVIVPGGDASTSAPLGAGGTSDVTKGQLELLKLQDFNLPASLPNPSSLFADLGGHDLYEPADAMPVILNDLKRMYTAIVRTPLSCAPNSLFPLRLQPIPNGTFPASSWLAPQWLLQRDSGKAAIPNR